MGGTSGIETYAVLYIKYAGSDEGTSGIIRYWGPRFASVAADARLVGLMGE
jgi:hypothetical protein